MIIEAVIDKIMFKDFRTHYHILKATDDENVQYTFKGTLPFAFEGLKLKFYGEFVDDKFSKDPVFIFNHASLVSSNNMKLARGILRLVVGVGDTTINKITDTFKEKTYDILLDNPEKLYELNGIGVQKIESIKKQVIQVTSLIKLFDISSGSNLLSPKSIINVVTKAINDGNTNIIDEIKFNPYLLCKLNSTIEPTVIDIVVKNNDYSFNKELRAFRTEAYLINLLKKKNSTYLPLKFTLNSLTRSSKTSREELYENLEELENMQLIRFTEDDKIYVTYLEKMEEEISYKLHELSQIKPIENIDNAIRLSKKYKELTEEQQNAVTNSLKYGFSIITGFPGVGNIQIAVLDGNI